MEKFLEAGRIVNTHGVRGEVRITPWCDSAEFLRGFNVFHIDGQPMKVLGSRVHKGNLLASLENVSDINEAMKLKGKTVYIDRSGLELPRGRWFIADLIGLDIIDDATGGIIGRLTEVLSMPAHDVYVVDGRHMIPAVKEFIAAVDMDAGNIRVRLIEGMISE